MGSKAEPSEAQVRCPELGCGETIPCHAIPATGKRSSNLDSSSNKDPWGVLKEDHCGLKFIDDAEHVWPEPSLVFDAESLPRAGDGLAGEPRSDEIHCSTPRSSVEGFEARPDRRRIQPPFFHSLDQNGGCICFPFDVSDRAHAKASKREVEPADPGAETEGT